MNKFRQPVVAVSHGYIGLDTHSKTAKNVADIFNKIYTSDAQLSKRILFLSAHWEGHSNGIEISKPAAPEMFYDYSGFPAVSYELVYGAKGDSAFATRVNDLLSQSSIASKLVERPYDHGTFVPMFLTRPQADIPIVIMSANDRTLNAKAHFEPSRQFVTKKR
ncbi:hypothetical protein V7S43_015488 [Phytophthora oleae]|uniref:Extradiol ring-cleavage dioxygenase class III enzyme subunit B domain-containing protein n=1 Tax=Phytophthora oleae TaxID=2107226 RepID=A0ABD3F0J4_9STRA